MSALTWLPIPLWSPPEVGPWRLRENWPDGRRIVCRGLNLLFDDKLEAQRWADMMNRVGNPEGIVYAVVQSPESGSI